MQERLRDARQRDLIPDTLLLLEHPPVYTKGRRAQPSDLPMGEDWYLSQGIDVADSDRGGQVTYHGPGQLVGYPIMRVREVPAYVHALEEVMVTALADEGIEAEVREGLTGVWAGESKIGSIGVHVSRGVTTHGFAVNVDGDLQPFEWIVPCGMDGRAHDLAAQGDRSHRRDVVLPQARGVAVRGGVRAASAAGFTGAAGAGGLARVGSGMSAEHRPAPGPTRAAPAPWIWARCSRSASASRSGSRCPLPAAPSTASCAG